jgi:hypothetical protein
MLITKNIRVNRMDYCGGNAIVNESGRCRSMEFPSTPEYTEIIRNSALDL